MHGAVLVALLAAPLPTPLQIRASIWPAAPAPAGGEAAGVDESAPDPGLRLSAIIRAGIRARPDDLRRIASLLEAPDAGVRLAATRALVGASDAAALERMTAQASHQSAAMRLEGLTVLREAPTLPLPARRAAERALADSDPALRMVALELLAVHPAADSASAVAGALADGNREVRLAAVRVLRLAPDRRAVLPLLERLDNSDRAERSAVIEALGAFGGLHPQLDPGPALVRQLNDVPDDVELAAIEALGRLRFAPAVPTLTGIATQGSRERRARRAALALGEIANDAAIAVLVGLLREPAPTDEVVAALRRAGAAAVKPVAAVLRDGSSTSAVAAAGILAQAGDRAATPFLAEAVTAATTPAVAISAARALGKLRDPQAVPALTAAARRPGDGSTAGVREASLQALAAIGDQRAAGIVETAARDRDPRIRAAALQVGAALRAGLSRETLVARLADPSPLVRSAALRTASAFPALRLAAPVLETIAAWNAHSERPDDGEMADLLEALLTEHDRALLLEVSTHAPEPRRALLWRALAGLPQPMASSRPLPAEMQVALLAALERGDEGGRAAAEVLSSSPVDSATVQGVVARLATIEEPACRARLCPLLAHARTRHADAVLVDLLLRDPDDGVRAAAAWAARGRREEPLVGRALQAARQGSAGPVAANAAAALEGAEARAHPGAGAAGTTGPPAAPLSASPWMRVRLIAPDGTPLARTWVRARRLSPPAAAQTLWALSDDDGEARLSDLLPGRYALSTDVADQLARTAAIASGRSPATTPVAP